MSLAWPILPPVLLLKEVAEMKSKWTSGQYFVSSTPLPHSVFYFLHAAAMSPFFLCFIDIFTLTALLNLLTACLNPSSLSLAALDPLLQLVPILPWKSVFRWCGAESSLVCARRSSGSSHPHTIQVIKKCVFPAHTENMEKLKIRKYYNVKSIHEVDGKTLTYWNYWSRYMGKKTQLWNIRDNAEEFKHWK